MIAVSLNSCVTTVLSRSDMTHMPSISCEVYSPGVFFFFFLNASAPGTLAPFNILDKIFQPQSFETSPSLLCSLSLPSPLFSLSPLSPLSTHLRLFICYSVAAMWSTCVWLPSTHRSSVVNLGTAEGTIVDPPSSLLFTPRRILATWTDRWISKHLLGYVH